jgi:hypothetical protein
MPGARFHSIQVRSAGKLRNMTVMETPVLTGKFSLIEDSPRRPKSDAESFSGD